MKKYLLLLSILLLQNLAFAGDPLKVTGTMTKQMETYDTQVVGYQDSDVPTAGEVYFGSITSWDVTYYYYAKQALYTADENATITLTQCNVTGGGNRYGDYICAIHSNVKAVFVSGTIRENSRVHSTFYCAEGSESTSAESDRDTITTIKKSAGSGGTVVVPTPSPSPIIT